MSDAKKNPTGTKNDPDLSSPDRAPEAGHDPGGQFRRAVQQGDVPHAQG